MLSVLTPEPTMLFVLTPEPTMLLVLAPEPTMLFVLVPEPTMLLVLAPEPTMLFVLVPEPTMLSVANLRTRMDDGRIAPPTRGCVPTVSITLPSRESASTEVMTAPKTPTVPKSGREFDTGPLR